MNKNIGPALFFQKLFKNQTFIFLKNDLFAKMLEYYPPIIYFRSLIF